MTPHPAANTPDATDVRVVRSHAFGEVSVPLSAVMRFTSPLWGFPERHDYVLLPAARQGLFWLQSVDDETTTFILADPFQLDPGYAFDLGDTDREALRIASPDEVLGMVLLTLPPSGEGSVTANYRAPIVFNIRERAAVQIVTSDDSHSLRAPVDLTVFPPQSDGLKML